MTTTANAKVASKTFLRLGVSLTAVAIGAGAFALPAMAQDTAPAAGTTDDTTVVVVTGFRGSLQSSISAKKKENMIVDVIKSEDIAAFPDLNLAESLQRIPGVAIDRDGGEGRSITVRGLNSEFTRVRLNGLEALATAGGKDNSGGANRSRGFDFNIFASDLFNSLTVRKSLAAEIEEGSLGATIDMQTARPFDYKGFTMAASGQIGYNDLSRDNSPRGTFLISNRWADGRLGALFSVAYGERLAQEEGPNTGRWENGRGSFDTVSPGASSGFRFKNYSTTGAAGPFIAIPACNSAAACPALTPGSDAQKITDALHPRIPRYSRMITDQKRLGMTASFQMRPNPNTTISLDGMYATYGANREEYEIEAISFSRAGQGTPQTSIYDYTIDSEQNIVKGSFNNVDIRSEHRFDELLTTFKQATITWDQRFGDKLSMKALIGGSTSLQDNPEQTTFTFDAYDVQGYSYDYTNSRAPVFNYGTKNGFTIDQAGYWSYTPNVTANANTQPAAGSALGDASLIRIRPQSVENRFNTAKVDFVYDATDSLTFKFGGSRKSYDFTSVEFGRYTFNPLTRDEASNNNYSAGLNTLLSTNLAQYSQTVTVAGNTYLIPNLDAIRDTTHFDCRCTNSYGTFTVNTQNGSSRANNRDAHEIDTSSYIQGDFEHELMGLTFRGNLGVRYVSTEQTTTGIIGKGTTLIPTTIHRKYKDTLPALNVMVEPVKNLFVRFAASKTMARPTLVSLSPGGSISTTPGNNTLSLGNPFLDPVRANTLDLSFEYYPDKDSLYTVSLFQKDITSYIQNQVIKKTWGDTGLDTAALGVTATDDVTVTQPINTPGGMLKGYEISLQKPFTFLPGPLKHFGGIINYTHVESQINYVVASTATTVTYRKANLLNLSPESLNATLYYENDAFAARVSYAYRAPYISIILPGSGADFQGKNATKNIDAQFTYKLNSHFTLTLEGINLTDQADDRNDQYNTIQGNTGQDVLLDYATSGRQIYAGVRYKY